MIVLFCLSGAGPAQLAAVRLHAGQRSGLGRGRSGPLAPRDERQRQRREELVAAAPRRDRPGRRSQVQVWTGKRGNLSANSRNLLYYLICVVLFRRLFPGQRGSCYALTLVLGICREAGVSDTSCMKYKYWLSFNEIVFEREVLHISSRCMNNNYYGLIHS